MPQNSRPADWNLPPGVAPGTWDYVHSPHIANQYDEFLANTPLTKFDLEILERLLPPATSTGGIVADLGCGTGRTLPVITKQGYRMLGIDLSQTMLEELGKRGDSSQPSEKSPLRIRANIVNLDCLHDNSIDHALCLFSTLGMVRGHRHRAEVIRHVFRILKPGGTFLLHVHNLRAALRDPGGLKFLWQSYRRARRNPEYDFGDRIYGYRGLADMFLHSFRPSELSLLIANAGFKIADWHCLTIHGDALLPVTTRFASWKAGGFMVLCQRPVADDASSPRSAVAE